MFVPEQLHRIAVVGIGGCGHNAVDYLAPDLAEDVDLWVFDTDARGMVNDERVNRIAIGGDITNGLSSGAIPEVAEKAAEHDSEIIKQHIQGYDLVFVTGGLGGGTGTGVIPLITNWLRPTKTVCITIVTTPFGFEGNKKARLAQTALDNINQTTDSSIVVSNQKLLTTLPKSSSLISAFNSSNEVLKRSLIGIYSLISTTGYINLDFADLRTALHQSGPSMIGYGEGVGEHRIQSAVNAALDNPLLNDFDMTRSKGVLINITSDASIRLDEIHLVGELLTEEIKTDIPIIIGNVITETENSSVKIYAIFSGVPEIALTEDTSMRLMWQKS